VLLEEYSSTATGEDETDLDNSDDILLAPRITRSRAAVVAPAAPAAPAAAERSSSAARKDKVKALLGELVDVLLV